MQPAPQPTRPGRLRGRPRVPVQEVAEREQVTEVDRRVELNAGECRVGLAVEQRVDPALRRERRVAHGRRIGAREPAAAQPAARAMGAACRIGQGAAAVAGPAVAQDGLGYRVAAWAAADQQHAVRDADEAPAKLPAEQPGAVLVQAVRAEPRAADQHLVSLSGGCERRVQRPRLAARTRARRTARAASARPSRGRCRSRTRHARAGLGEATRRSVQPRARSRCRRPARAPGARRPAGTGRCASSGQRSRAGSPRRPGRA